MTSRRKNKKPYKKIILAFFGASAALTGLFLFIVGLVSLVSFLPIQNEENEQVIVPVVKTANIQELRNILAEKNIIIDELRESSTSAVIRGKIKDGPEIFFSKTKDALFQANSLQLIISKLTIGNKEPKVIDLRLDRPIVKY